MCGYIRPIVECGPPLGERINKDIKELTERTGIDFEQFTAFMWNNPNYAVVVYPDMIKASNGRTFNCYLESSYKSIQVLTINSQSKDV
jgi:hypothetical protein